MFFVFLPFREAWNVSYVIPFYVSHCCCFSSLMFDSREERNFFFSGVQPFLINGEFLCCFGRAKMSPLNLGITLLVVNECYFVITLCDVFHSIYSEVHIL